MVQDTGMIAEACDVCGDGSMVPHVEVALPRVGSVWINRCVQNACGFRQIRPRLTVPDLSAFYSADYFDDASQAGFQGYARQWHRYQRDAYFLARDLRAFRSRGRLLEVGSALGFLLGALAGNSDWTVEGVEISSFGAWYTRNRFGLTVHQSTLEAAHLQSNSFDFVIQKDLLEHVLEPRRHLEETFRIMRPGARMRLITPNGDADVGPMERARLGSPSEIPVLEQGHVSFFTRRHLLRLLNETGFTVLGLRNIGLRRGIRALGVVPFWQRRPAVILRDDLMRTVRNRNELMTDADVEKYRQRAERMDKEIERSSSWLRRWKPYYYYRYLVKCCDALPSSLTFGQDFDVLVQKV